MHLSMILQICFGRYSPPFLEINTYHGYGKSVPGLVACCQGSYNFKAFAVVCTNLQVNLVKVPTISAIA